MGTGRDTLEERILDFPHVGDLHYRAGVAREQTYDWETAAAHHLAATTLDPKSPGRHFRLGTVRERRSDFTGAIEAYRSAVFLDSQSREDWHYRLAYCLQAIGRTDEAIEVFLGMMEASMPHFGELYSASYAQAAPTEGEASCQRANLERKLKNHHVSELSELGTTLLELGMFPEAVRAFEAVVRQDDDQKSGPFFRLAAAYLACNERDSALGAFLNVQKFRSPAAVGRAAYFDKPWQLSNMEYVEYSQTYPLEESHVVFESYLGRKIDCNPAAYTVSLGKIPPICIFASRGLSPVIARSQPTSWTTRG